MNFKPIEFIHSLLVFDHTTSIRKTFNSDAKFLTLLLSLVVLLFLVASFVWNIELGRDWHRYFIYFFKFPADPNLFTLPGTPLVLGTIAKGGFFAFYLFLFVAYLTTIFGSYYVARLFSQNMARIVSLLALGHMQLTLIHVKLNSDPLFVMACTLLAISLVRLYKQQDIYSYALIGLAILFAAMVRPIGQLFGILFLLPIVCFGFSKKNLLLAGVIFAVVVSGFAGVAVYHYSELGKFVITEGSGGLIFRGAYLQSRVISPDNGPASKRLGKLVDQLVKDPIYKEAGITADKFFSDPNKYYYYDMANAQPKSIQGVDNYMEKIKFFSDVTKEAIAAKPIQYLQGVYKNISFTFTRVYDSGPLPLPPSKQDPDKKAAEKKCKYTASCYYPTKTTVASLRRAKFQDDAPQEQKDKQQMLKIYLESVEEMFKSTPFSPSPPTDSIGSYVRYYLGEFARSLIYKYPSMLTCAFLSVLLLIGVKQKEIRLTILFLIPSIACPAISSMIDPLANYRIPHDIYIMMGAAVALTLLVQLLLNIIGLENRKEA
ncbi:MAG: hypothetical protein HQL69_23340 [Magnetococcales bacterium]|nr:hypothetical protein [Magnetococcales bacterium]